ncbi:hypothetical protein AUQ44_01780 [Vibrio cidicii]|uniref:Uncharacterized protein n=1 Tax=Vibrio cidicii TaxID=1763883 RepID=A0A151JFV9_9VIBR|nr:hypothetical protein [Vibrio cidicii]KYN24651.1 hypothetical protein AUQ44_01780 [Vibrio cidicii]
MRIIKQVIVLVSVFLLLSCSDRVDRTDLQELIKNRQFSSLIEVVDGYIEENEDDEFGYYAKATALIHLKKESSGIQSVLYEAFLEVSRLQGRSILIIYECYASTKWLL